MNDSISCVFQICVARSEILFLLFVLLLLSAFFQGCFFGWRKFQLEPKIDRKCQGKSLIYCSDWQKEREKHFFSCFEVTMLKNLTFEKNALTNWKSILILSLCSTFKAYILWNYWLIVDYWTCIFSVLMTVNFNYLKQFNLYTNGLKKICPTLVLILLHR